MAGKRIHDLDEVVELTLDDLFALDQEREPDVFKTYRTELRNIRDVVLGGDERFILLENGDNLLLEDGDNFLLEGSGTPVPQSYVGPIVTVSANDTLNEVKYYRITGGTTFTITTAITVFSTAVPFVIEIKNASGSTITINRSGSDTFYEVGGTSTTFDLSDGGSVKLVAATTSTWDIISSNGII